MNKFQKCLALGGLIAGALAVSGVVRADSAESSAPANGSTVTPWYEKVAIGGYLEEYYQQSLNRPSDSNAAPYRLFDTTTNQFSFGGGELTLKLNDDSTKTGYVVDLLLGPMAARFNSAGTNDLAQFGQAYLTQRFGDVLFTLGKFEGPLGYESVSTPLDANFSRGLLRTNEVLFSTGIKADYLLPAGFTVSAFADDGSNADNAVTAGKDYGLEVAYSGVKNLDLRGVWDLNPAMTLATGEMVNIDWFNFVGSYAVSSKLSFAGEYLFKESMDPFTSADLHQAAFSPKQQGYALYATYNTPVSNLSVSPRFEQWFSPDANGASVGADTASNGTLASGSTPYVLDDYTLTLKYAMGALTHSLEYRVDASNRYEFNIGKSGPSYSQLDQTLTYAAVYSF